MKPQKPQKQPLSRACLEAIQAKKPWAPRYGIPHALYNAYAELEPPAVVSKKMQDKNLERLRERLVIVPCNSENEFVSPHIFCLSRANLGRNVFYCGIRCHPLAAIFHMTKAISGDSEMSLETLKLWGTHAAVDDKTLDLYVPVRFRGRNPNSRNFDKLEKKRVKLYLPLWKNTCGEVHCINPLHLEDQTVKLSLLGHTIGEPLHDAYAGWADLTPILENPLFVSDEPPKFNKPRHVFEPRVMPQADLNMPTGKFKDLVKPLPKFYDKNGFDEDGFDREGYDKDGYDLAGCDRNGDAAPTPPELVPRVERRDTQDGFEIDLVVTTGKASLLAAYAKENGFTADFNANSFTLRSPNKDVANFNFILGGILQRGAFYPLVEVQP